MAGWLVSSILSISRLVATVGKSISASPSASSTDPRNSIKEDLRKLERTLERIQAVLHDAEEREIQDESVKLWLRELSGVAYNAEDVLDEYQYEVFRMEAEDKVAAATATHKRKRVEEGEENLQQQVCDLPITCSSSKVSIWDGMGDKIREISMRFDEIASDRDRLRLRLEDGERRFEFPIHPPPSGPLVDNSGVFGRMDDKKKVIDLLFSNMGCPLTVIPIVGMGGLGKTTLSQLIYNDPKISSYFNLRAWVSVSVDFDAPRLMRRIIESISNEPCGLTELSSLQDTLKKKVEEKSVLLVLDDVWNEKRGLWESLQVALLGGKCVRVIVTTRNSSVTEMMRTVPPYILGVLPEGQCRLLFRRHAFGGENPEIHENLIEIGDKIVKKCAGLPLAVKALGCSLGSSRDIERWEEVLESDYGNWVKPIMRYCQLFD